MEGPAVSGNGDHVKLSVGRRLLVFGVLSVALVAAVGGFAASRIPRDNALARYSDSVRASAEADMQHDAIRADVFGGLLAVDDAGRQSAEADLADHSSIL